ncbi:hypothetical protein GWI33_002718 [Rhynchophorus ferrugineus]|uniref:Uncharacterized protein n=1 Tax=Rhynchophorus ferrugineus TaxID=354439 RepID=A0A834ML68_RHYFE|nr:hypothetical protein GWI33_002718 [Rhynchophorus ferrugineus]
MVFYVHAAITGLIKVLVHRNESDHNFSEFSETHDQKRKQPKPSGTNYCIPDTCDKLNPRKKRDKSCCRNPNCPINDANSSTYKFLLKVRMCCRKRGCQLAARICDIYEPLVKVDMDQTPENGDEKYHYLGKDDWTDYENIATSIETNHKWLELQEKEESAANFIRDYKKPDMNDIDMLRESVYVEPEKKEDRRRASTVSWHVSRTGSSDDLLVNKATEEAQKFRQGQQVTRAGSMFSTIMRQKDKDKDDIFDKPEGTLNYHTDSKFLLFKSQLDTVNPKVSHHRTQCWTAIKNKVRQRKKKKNPERRTSSIHWISNTDITDRKTLNIDAPTNIEKNAD